MALENELSSLAEEPAAAVPRRWLWQGRPAVQVACVLTLLAIGSFSRASAEILYTTDGYSLFRIDSENPESLVSSVPLAAGYGCPTTLAVDPSSRALYSVTCFPCELQQPSFVEIREIDPRTGDVVRLVEYLPALARCNDKDIASSTGEMRIVHADGTNQRLRLTDGLVFSDTPLAPLRWVRASAHLATAGGFETYALSSGLGFGCELLRVGGPGGNPPASSGEVAVIGSCGPSMAIFGFDISPSGQAYVGVHGSTENHSSANDFSLGLRGVQSALYSIDIATGVLTLIGGIPSAPEGGLMMALAVAPPDLGVVEVPALERWGLVLFGALLALLAARRLGAPRPGGFR